MAGKGGGAWKVAYADFVTAMMAFFLVMWIVAQNQPVREAVAGYFKDPYGTSSKPSGSGILPGRERPTASSKGPPKGQIGIPRPPAKPPTDKDKPTSDEDPTAAGRKANLVVVDQQSETSLGAVVRFAEASAEIDAAGAERLDGLLPTLLGKPNKIEIRGHATRRPLPADSPYKDPWQLSYARCLAAMKHLAEKGVEPERIRISQAGPFEPKSTSTEASLQAQNSRVEVFVLNEFAANLKNIRKDSRPGRAPKLGDKARAILGTEP